MEDIDAVIIWVNGNDPKWNDEKNKYISEENGDKREIRYRDWNNLQYIFRGIEKFMPWIRKVFFVTWGHLPVWLNVNCDKLQIVNHTDFIPKEYLPTFSSTAIELNLHRIKGLSDKFIYFNDDVFVLKKMKKENFFKDGKPVRVAALDAYAYKTEWNSFIGASCTAIINDHFDKRRVIKENWRNWFRFRYGKNLYKTIVLYPWRYFTGLKHSHLAEPFLKSTFTEVWEQERTVLDNTCKHRFRESTDVSQWLISYWEIVRGDFYPGKINGDSFNIKNKKDAEKCARMIRNKKNKNISVNDCLEIGCKEHFTEVTQIINMALEEIMPEKSEFEI